MASKKIWGKNIEDKPFVSITLATYNGERFLRKQLDSLLAQTYSNFELVISDDGSTDKTSKILDEYQTKDKRIKWTSNPNPAGFVKNFERAISLCKGKIIFLCDQDDVWYKDKVGMHVRAHQEASVSWVYNRVVLINEEGQEIGHLEDTAPDYYKKRRILDNTWGSCILGCATSYRAPALHNVMPVGKYAPAHDSWIQLALFPQKSFFIDKVLQDYRIHSSNTAGWGRTPTKEKEQQAIADNLHYLKRLSVNPVLPAWKRFFFLCVYVGKIVRALVRRLMLK